MRTGGGQPEPQEIVEEAEPEPQQQAQPEQDEQPEPEQQQATVDVPGPVGGLQLSATPGSLTVSWTAPETGDAPRRHIVHVKKVGGKGKTKRPKAPKTSVTFSGLESGATYNVWVRAQNAGGKGERVSATITLPE